MDGSVGSYSYPDQVTDGRINEWHKPLRTTHRYVWEAALRFGDEPPPLVSRYGDTSADRRRQACDALAKGADTDRDLGWPIFTRISSLGES